MGTVLLARERALERMVAIKVLHADKAADAEARERFRREARSAAKLTHPNIVPLLTFGDVEGELYFVMGYIEGETLAARLERAGRVEPDEARARLAELAEALDYAHKAGIVHRDVKPENILLDRATGRAMLTDFGIARELGREASLTSTGIIVGTPHYMSPEQASGDRAIDGRSDIYSLGVIGYRMVSGTLPFGGASVREVIAQHLTASPAPLPEAVEQRSPGLSGALLRALAKSPSDRWPTAGELTAALRADGAEEVLPEELETIEGSYTRMLIFGAASGAALPLLSLAGLWSEPLGLSALTGLGLLVGVGALVWAAVRHERYRHPARAAASIRVGFRPPRWWSTWWPRKYRRPGDVWDRLPAETRIVRWTLFLFVLVVAPLEAVGLIWILSDAGAERFAHLAANQRPLVNGVSGVAFAIFFGLFGAIHLLQRRLRRRLGLDYRRFSQAQGLANADPRWRQPRYAVLLSPAAGASEAAPRTPVLIAALRVAGVALPEGLTEALEVVERAEVALDRELRELRELVNAEEIQRVDKRIAGLGRGDPQLRAMLESQRALLARAESRIAELGALKGRLDAQQALLRQQLVALRDLAPSGADISEITGRIRAVNADLRALAEGLAEV